MSPCAIFLYSRSLPEIPGFLNKSFSLLKLNGFVDNETCAIINIVVGVVCLQQENKFRQEMEEHKQKLDKEYEQLMQTFIKDLDKIRMKHQQDLDKAVSSL